MRDGMPQMEEVFQCVGHNEDTLEVNTYNVIEGERVLELAFNIAQHPEDAYTNYLLLSRPEILRLRDVLGRALRLGARSLLVENEDHHDGHEMGALLDDYWTTRGETT